MDQNYAYFDSHERSGFLGPDLILEPTLPALSGQRKQNDSKGKLSCCSRRLWQTMKAWMIITFWTRKYLFAVPLIAATAGLAGYLGYFRSIGLPASLKTEGCFTDGTFVGVESLLNEHRIQRRPKKSTDLFHPRYIFAITLPVIGPLDFSVAKLIDVSWDIIVGRVGQWILVYAAYRVFAKVLINTMETNAMSHTFFAALAFENVSAYSTWQMMKDRQHRRMGFRGWLIILGMILASVFIISFPTIVSAMTGYSTLYKPYASVEGSLVSLEHFERPTWMVVDGSRIGLRDWAPITGSENLRELHKYQYRYYAYEGRIANDARNITSNITIDGKDWKLDAPPLNITSANVASANTFLIVLVYNNKAYDFDYFEQYGSCQPGQQYIWGFSILLLFIGTIFLCLFTTIMAALWIYADRRSHLAKQHRKLGTFRAAMDLATAVRQELGKEADSLSDKELEKQLERSSKGMMYCRDSLQVICAEYKTQGSI